MEANGKLHQQQPLLKVGGSVDNVHSNKVEYHPRAHRVNPSEWFEPYQRNYRECTRWDHRGNRFLVSIFDGGLGAVPFHLGWTDGDVHEQVLVPSAPRPGLSHLGFCIDYPRNRVVCCASDKLTYSLSTLVAYDYTTWETLFVVELSGADNPSRADDVTLDPEGNMYVTDTKNGKIWKVKCDGSEFNVFSDDPSFQLDPISKYYSGVKLNGIVYHPKRFFLVTHLAAHALFKVSMDGRMVTRVLGLTRELLGDGVALLDDNKLVMAGLDVGVHILATTDEWETAVETHHSPAPSEKFLPTSVSLKDGRPFVGYVKLELNTFNTIAQPVFFKLTN